MPSNFDTKEITASIATTETTVGHSLGRAPSDAFIVMRTGSGNVFRGATAWNASNIFLQASATVSVTILLF